MSYPLYIIFGVLPSIIWLCFYLRKDRHPESNRMVIKIFFYGMLIALPAIFLEIGLLSVIGKFNFSPFYIALLNAFFGVALVEELLKYLVVKGKVLNNPEFDEPIDVILYMIIAALGFAAVENILILLRLGPTFLVAETLSISLFRFLGATLLHALASGAVGFFLALALFETKRRRQLIIFGLGMSVFLHGLYNFAIMEIGGNLKIFIPLIVILSLAVFVSFGFKKLQKLASVCKIC